MRTELDKSNEIQKPNPTTTTTTAAAAQKKYYEVWESKNMVLFKGKFMIGSETRYALGTFALINIPPIIYEIFVAPGLANVGDCWSSFIIILGCLLLTDLFFFATLLKDPGIIPRNVLMYETDNEKRSIPYKNVIKRQHIETRINTHFLRVKYCETCHIYRPPRTSHCNICDNCVERFDHHCPWLGACIGKRNYRVFYGFVFCITCLDLYVLGSSIAHMVIKGQQYDSFLKFLSDYPFSLIMGCFSFLFMFFVVGLCGFHTYLVTKNQTTYENIKKTWERISGNPYAKKSFIELQRIVNVPVENASNRELNDSSEKNIITSTMNVPYLNANNTSTHAIKNTNDIGSKDQLTINTKSITHAKEFKQYGPPPSSSSSELRMENLVVRRPPIIQGIEFTKNERPDQVKNSNMFGWQANGEKNQANHGNNKIFSSDTNPSRLSTRSNGTGTMQLRANTPGYQNLESSINGGNGDSMLDNKSSRLSTLGFEITKSTESKNGKGNQMNSKHGQGSAIDKSNSEVQVSDSNDSGYSSRNALQET